MLGTGPLLGQALQNAWDRPALGTVVDVVVGVVVVFVVVVFVVVIVFVVVFVVVVDVVVGGGGGGVVVIVIILVVFVFVVFVSVVFVFVVVVVVVVVVVQQRSIFSRTHAHTHLIRSVFPVDQGLMKKKNCRSVIMISTCCIVQMIMLWCLPGQPWLWSSLPPLCRSPWQRHRWRWCSGC